MSTQSSLAIILHSTCSCPWLLTPSISFAPVIHLASHTNVLPHRTVLVSSWRFTMVLSSSCDLVGWSISDRLRVRWSCCFFYQVEVYIWWGYEGMVTVRCRTDGNERCEGRRRWCSHLLSTIDQACRDVSRCWESERKRTVLITFMYCDE